MKTKIQAFFVLTDENGAILTYPETDKPLMYSDIGDAAKAQEALRNS